MHKSNEFKEQRGYGLPMEQHLADPKLDRLKQYRLQSMPAQNRVRTRGPESPQSRQPVPSPLPRPEHR